MSRRIRPEDREDEENSMIENKFELLDAKQLELLEVKQDKGAKTFIYRDPSQTRKRESLWGRLWGEKSRSVE